MWSPTQPACTDLSPTRCILFVICTYLVKSRRRVMVLREYVVVRQSTNNIECSLVTRGRASQTWSGNKMSNGSQKNFISQRIPKKTIKQSKKRTQSDKDTKKVSKGRGLFLWQYFDDAEPRCPAACFFQKICHLPPLYGCSLIRTFAAKGPLPLTTNFSLEKHQKRAAKYMLHDYQLDYKSRLCQLYSFL